MKRNHRKSVPQVLKAVTACVLATVAAHPALADNASVKVGDINTDQDTAITIRKGESARRHGLDEKDFEIISGSDEIFGDPVPGKKAGYESWKTACAAWKKEMRENNKDNQVLTLNCNSPSFAQDAGNYTYTSSGTYKLRVRVRADSH